MNLLNPGHLFQIISVVSFGNTDLVALHVPGHTVGSLAFYSEKNGCVFTGDAFLQEVLEELIFLEVIMIHLLTASKINYLFFLLRQLFIPDMEGKQQLKMK